MSLSTDRLRSIVPAAETSLDRMMDHGGERNPVRYAQLGEHGRSWVFTVCGEMHSRLATAPFVSPRPPAARPPAQSRSVPVRLSRPVPRPALGWGGRRGARNCARTGLPGHRRPPARRAPVPHPAATASSHRPPCAYIPVCAGVSRPNARTSPLPNWPQRDTLRRSPHCAEEMFCAPTAAACLSFRRHSYSAISRGR